MTKSNGYKIALFGGLVIGILPAWFITLLVELIPSLEPDKLGEVAEFLSGGIGLLQILFFIILVFILPVLEEAIFRGAIWNFLLKCKISSYHTWLIISVIFAAIHVEPLHVLGLMPFSFFAGWLRYRTGILGPSIVAHMANNAVACILVML